jgi:hypothetical protein
VQSFHEAPSFKLQLLDIVYYNIATYREVGGFAFSGMDVALPQTGKDLEVSSGRKHELLSRRNLWQRQKNGLRLTPSF